MRFARFRQLDRLLEEFALVKAYRCRVCENTLYFENSICVSCGSNLGYARGERAIVPVDDQGQYVDAAGLVWHVCANLDLNGCTWLTELDGDDCFACKLTQTRPNDTDVEGLGNYRLAEQAIRHVVVELDTLGFPLVGKDPSNGGDPDNGLAFDLLSSSQAAGGEHATIGHADGLITIDLAEADDAYRAKVKDRLGEPYRTMLGHIRHEVGHYIEWQLVTGDEVMARCRELFGDESKDYQAEIDRHYEQGPPAGWEESYISEYATMHPFEDFAECWAHYLHICDTLETASEFGLTAVAPVSAFSQFRDVVTGVWVPLSVALNMINRSMGKGDLYPFVIPDPVLDKLEFVASLAAPAQ